MKEKKKESKKNKKFAILGITIIILATIISLIYAEWQPPNQQIDENTLVIISPINSTGTIVGEYGFMEDISILNGSINFSNRTASGTLDNPATFISGGRDGDGAYQYLTSTNNFLNNSANPFSFHNNSGTICISTFPNASAASLTTFLSAGNSGETSATLSYLPTSTPIIFRYSKQCGSTESIVRVQASYNASTWITQCMAWVGNSASPRMYLYVVRDDNITLSNFTAAPDTGDGNSNCGGDFESAGGLGDLVRIGGDRGDASSPINVVFDSLMFWNRNITLEEINRYHLGNWTTVPLRINASNASIQNGTNYNQSTIHFSTLVNSTNNFTAYFMVNESACNNPPSCTGTSWTLLCINSCSNQSNNYIINTSQTGEGFETNWNRNTSTNGSNINVTFIVDFVAGSATDPRTYVYFINGTKLNNTGSRTYANFSVNKTWFSVTSIASQLNFTDTGVLPRNGTLNGSGSSTFFFFNISNLTFNFSMNISNNWVANITINTSPPSPDIDWIAGGGNPIAIANITGGLAGQNIFTNLRPNTTLADGDYIYNITILDLQGNRNHSTAQWFSVDTVAPRLNVSNPIESGANFSNNSLMINFTAFDRKLFNVTVFVWRQRDLIHAIHYADRNMSTANFTAIQELPFTVEYNHTIEIVAFDGNGSNRYSEGSNSIRRNVSWYYDTNAPNITITQPIRGSTVTTTSVNLNVTVQDNRSSALRCYYEVYNLINNPMTQEVARTNYDCSSNVTFTASNNVNFSVFVYADDQIHNTTSQNISFRVETSGGGGGAGTGGGAGGGGGGGSSETTILSVVEGNKSICDINIEPIDIFVTSTNQLAEVKIKNNEVSSFTPSFKFNSIIGEKDYSQELSIANPVGSILQDQEVSFGVRYGGSSIEIGRNDLVLSSPECNDIILNININKERGITELSKIYNPSLTFNENMVDFLSSSTIDYEFIIFIKNWMTISLLALILTIIDYNFLKGLNQKGRRVSLVLTVLFVNILLPVFLTMILYLVGG